MPSMNAAAPMSGENRPNEVMIELLVKLKSGALSIAMDLSARVSTGADRTFHNFLQNRSAKFVEKQTRDSEVAPEQTEMRPADSCELAGRQLPGRFGCYRGDKAKT